jgi:hypothetical protein
MKHTLLFTLLFCSYFNGICQTWTIQEFDKANTAANVNILTQEEKEVIKYLNLARLYPQKFAIIEVKDYSPSTYKESLLVTLRYKTPVGLLYFDESMYLLAKCFATESGESGKIGHNRISCSNGFDAECCSYGYEQGKDVVLQLLVDYDVPSLGHRNICLDDSYKKVGLSIKPHNAYQYCCVLDFTRSSRNKYKNEPIIQNSKQDVQPSYTNESTITNESNSKTTKTKRHKLLSLKLGGNANLLFDDVNNFSNLDNSINNQVSYNFNAMVGFNLGKAKKNTTLGIFGNFGKYNANNPTLLGNNLFSSTNNFLEIEGGFLIKEFFRISGGFGYSSSNAISFSSNNYATFSSGFSIGPKWLKLDILNTLIIPKNNQKLIYRPSVGLALVLNFVKKKS